jgi:hypothetical protein
VSIGPATVADDGSVVSSNRGVGIVKAGWHGGGNPAHAGTPADCPACKVCNGTDCVADPANLCKSCSAGSACDGEGACKTGRELIPKICNQLRLDSTDYRETQCPDDTEGGPGTCGAVLRIEYTKVLHSCDSVDLKGARITEEVIPDHQCTPPGFTVDQGGEFEVKPGNDITGHGDVYSLCAPLARLQIPYDCTETFTQSQKIDGCVRPVTIQFHITRTEAQCSGSVRRN